ncbi:hypothetical protein [Mesorhizobium sp. A556]
MFGITPLGWLHTLGSLPAIPAAAYMLVRHGRITPRSVAGRIYFVCMVIGGLTVFLVATAPESPIIGAATLLLLFAGYTVGRVTILGRVRRYLETFLLTLTVFLLMVPTVSEILRRVPDGHPIVTDPDSPILKGALASLVVMLIFGLAAQFIYLFKFKVSNRAR